MPQSFRARGRASLDYSSRWSSFAAVGANLQEGQQFGFNPFTMATASVLRQLALLGLTLLFASVSVAAEDGEKSLTIAEGERVNKDLFFAGEEANIKGQLLGDLFFLGKSIRVDGAVSGDLVAGLQELMLSGDIQGDIWTVGQYLRLAGQTRGDLRSAGQRLEIQGEVHGNTLFLGQEFHLAGEGMIGKNLRLVVREGILSGRVGGNLLGAAEKLVISGEVNGNVDVTAGKVMLEETAVIHGFLHYESEEEAVLAPGAQVVGAVKHSQPEQEEPTPQQVAEHWEEAKEGLLTFGRVVSWFLLLGFLAVGILWLLIFPRQSMEAADTLVAQPLASLGLGFALLVATPVAALLLFLTLIGLPAGSVLLGSYLILLYLSPIPVALWLGRRVLQLLRISENPHLIIAFIFGAFLLRLLFLLPWIGFLTIFLATVVGLGCVLLAGTIRWRAA